MLKLILPVVSLSVALFSLYMVKSAEKALEESSARHYNMIRKLEEENDDE